jgi:flagellar biosynthetic protein FliQ
MLAAPMLLSALATGLIVAIFQAATQINEMTLGFVPKIVVMFITMIIAGPWMLTTMTDYIRRLYNSIPGLIG